MERQAMATTVQNFIKLANFYNQMSKIMSAICVEKGGIAIDKYVGRFFAADVLEYIVEYGERLKKTNKNVPTEVLNVIEKFKQHFEKVRTLTTPSEKPIYEMTLEEFEKMMNI
ncbi:MAG: hypothetical protein K5912_02175 [Alphaproteobacteria bacterium]|nr:hypothetical protein [Alphaproteobacteria bacterium]